ncbi:HNH endonuclease [Brevundimonas phage vB_BpoS-Marchewka]|uniref:HNH endonuclease n=1 Tax=Brevundimonas phage vB_BpoS-Marchewka TaxID=2948604 RepID=A0A9E7SR94_9CAUD|nr:HNH endonuclease [Brevundimonas phage vB_BpoS-Marchewka]UTC29368.1 HNH endonuclease [Brevundimonas phage vB_BpoS-Bambus]
MFDAQDGLCHYCVGPMRLIAMEGGYQPPDMITLEHLTQKSDGGTYAEDNTRGACVACNVSRPNGLPTADYLALRRDLLVVWPPCTHPDRAVRRRLQRASPQSLYRLIAERSADVPV